MWGFNNPSFVSHGVLYFLVCSFGAFWWFYWLYLEGRPEGDSYNGDDIKNWRTLLLLGTYGAVLPEAFVGMTLPDNFLVPWFSVWDASYSLVAAVVLVDWIRWPGRMKRLQKQLS